MIAGLVAGVLADSYHPAVLAEFGCLLTLISLIIQLSFDQYTPYATVEGVLALSGIGVGFFQSPNTMSLMLSVDKNHRGLAAALNYLTLMFTSMLGIVITFNLVLNSVGTSAINHLFVQRLPLKDDDMRDFLHALRVDNYISIAVCGLSMICAAFNNMPDKKDEDVVGSVDDGDEDLDILHTIEEIERSALSLVFVSTSGESGVNAEDSEMKNEGDIELVNVHQHVVCNGSP